jgi:hypothetical protein
MTLPPQSPDRRPRSLRPRRDRYRLPRFSGPFHLDVERYEPRPLDWRELLDPSVWFGGVCVFVAIVLFVFAVSIQDVA